MSALLAASPIALILVLMLGLRRSAALAGGLGLALTLLLAPLAFGYGTRVLGELGVARAVLGALLEAALIALPILLIILPALAIHDLQQRTGSVAVLKTALERLSSDPRLGALLIAWFFALFLEGAAGFGTSAALAAPFLVGLGFGRVHAVAIALVGHSVGVSFGAVGTPILPQIAGTAYTGLELSAATGLYHAALGWVMPLVLMGLVLRGGPREGATGAIWGWTVLAAACFLVPFWVLARYVGPELPTLGGALAGGLLFTLALARFGGARGGAPSNLLRAAAPYLALVGLVLLTRLVPPVREVLGGLELRWAYGPFGAGFQPFYHPGTLLLLAFLLGALWQRAPRRDVTAALARASGQLGLVALALFAMLGLSRLMVHAGLIETLAEAVAGLTGGAWPLFAPFVGALGTFVTGSATASNILFSDFQAAAARAAALPPLPLLGAQGFGAAVGNIICPHNIIAAGATVALVGQEGEVLRRTLLPALLYAALGGVLALALARGVVG